MSDSRLLRFSNGSSVDEPTARAILEPYFLAAKDEYLEFCVANNLGSSIKNTRLAISQSVRDSDRHFAAATTDGRLIVASPELVECPEDTVAAMMAHEFGHIVDHLYPGRFLVVDEELVFLTDNPEDPRSPQVRVARMRQWENRTDHEIELTADLIAKQVLSHEIRYYGPCMLQSFGRGVKRPRDLR